MKEFIYSGEDIERLKLLLNRPFNRLACTFLDIIIEYPDSSFVIHCNPDSPATPNPGWDEIICSKLIWNDLTDCNIQEDDFIIHNSTIEEIKIVRGGLSFTKFVTWETKGPFDPTDLSSGSSGGNSEVMLNPDSKEFNDIPPDFKNLVDYGLILKVTGRYLKCFIDGNSFGFHGTMDQYYLDEPLLNRIITNSNYQIINVK